MRITVCKRFWDYGSKKHEQFILHELTHEGFGSKDGFDLDGDGLKEDVYGQSAVEELAKTHPEFSLHHADTYAIYAY